MRGELKMTEEKKPIIKIVTKETFEKALAKGNYKEVSKEARGIIDDASELDLLELKTEMGSALRVLSARKLDEKTFVNILCNN